MKRTVLAALLLLSVVPTASGQQRLPPSEKPPEVAASKPPSPAQIHLFFGVNDHKGHPAPDAQLAKEDLQVLDEGKPAEILDLRRAEDLPVRYALVLDLSGSGRAHSQVVPIALAAVDFLRNALRPGLDDAEVVAFRADVAAPIPFRPDELSSQLPKASFTGRTALYDALMVACQNLSGAKAEEQRRVILLLSDGEDNQSQHTSEEARRAALRSGVTIFAINTTSHGASQVTNFGNRQLRRLAEETGGRAFAPADVQDVTGQLAEIARHLRSQYLLVYRPGEIRPDGKLRSLRIAVSRWRELKIQAPAGYYPPQTYPGPGNGILK